MIITEKQIQIWKDECIKWIKEWFNENGKDCCAVIGISGGKDSTVAAALCVEALGKDRVIGVLLPNGIQSDINDAERVCEFLQIKYTKLNLMYVCEEIKSSIKRANNAGFVPINPTPQAEINLPPRVRMSMLYYVSQCLNGRVVNTCNLSEDWVGYSTRYGDAAGDFSPLGLLLTDEVIAIGEELGIPKELLYKAPSDGLCGKTDEDNLGFTYEVLNHYIRTGECKDKTIQEKINYLHKKNRFKTEPMPHYVPSSVMNRKLF